MLRTSDRDVKRARALDPVFCAPGASVITVEGLVGYQVALTREGARRQSDARLEEMMRERSLRQTLKLGADYSVPLHFPDRDLATGVLQKDVRSRQRRFQSRASPALDCRDGKWPLSVAAQFSLRRTRMRR